MARVSTRASTGASELPMSPARRSDLSVFDGHAPVRTSRLVKVERFIRESKKRFETSDAASKGYRSKMRIDQKFAAGGGNQWDPVDRQSRMDEGRPVLEINRIPQFIRQVANQNRANRSQIQIHARAGGATQKHAAAVQGVIRAIEVDSDADVAYDTATDHQLRIGIGFVRMKVAWEHQTKGMNRVVRLSRVRNPLAVYWDPSTQEADFSDMRYAHVVGVLGKEEYEARWGHLSTAASLSEFLRQDASSQDWAPEGKVVVCEYFYVVVEKRTLVQLEDGTELWQDELPDYMEAFAASFPGEAMPGVVLSRVVEAPRVKWALHNGMEILEGNADRTAGRDVPGTRIPLFPLIGDELDLDGQVDYRGMVRDAIDPARMYNFWTSSIAEAVALAPKAPWIAAAGQINDFIDDWKTANRVPHSVLLYNPKSVDGTLVPPPQRNVAEPAIQAMVAGLRESDQDLKAVMGLYEPSLGERGPSTSGKAIQAQQLQGQIANSNYLDNLQRLKRSIGRSLLEWIPVVYDTPRLQQLVSPDGKRNKAVIYAGQQNAPQDGQFPADVTEFYDLGLGEFEITVSTGPSFETERQAQQQWLLDLFKVLPGLAAIGADIVLEQSDWPAAQQLAKRAKAALPPQFQDEQDQATMLPRLMAENQQLKQHAQIAHQAVTKMAEVIEKEEISAASRVEVASIQAEASIQTALIKAGSAQAMAEADAAAGHFEAVIGQIHDAAQADVAHEQQLEQQAQQAAHTMDQADQSADHQAGLQQQQAALAPKPTPGKA